MNGLIKLIFGEKSVLSALLIKYVKLGVGNRGIVQGGCLSPFFCNLFLDDVDKNLARRGYLFAHYGDDYVIGCRSQADAHAALEFLNTEMNNVGLELNSEKTRIIDLEDSGQRLNFCGFKIFPNRFLLSDQSINRMHAKAKRLINEHFATAGNICLNLDDQQGLDGVELRNRPSERKRNKLLKKFPSLAMQDYKVVPRFCLFMDSWIEQHEIVEEANLETAIRPMVEYAVSKQKPSAE